MRRLRLAACLLADVAWQANPGFRADRGIEMALHGNWVAVNPAGRVIMAQACREFRARPLRDPRLAELCKEEQLKPRPLLGRGDAPRPAAVGRGRRGAQAHQPQPRQRRDPMSVRRGEEALIGDQVERRFVRLAELLGCEPVIASA